MFEPKSDFARLGWALLVAWIVAFVLFRAMPGIDLGITSLFYRGDSGFSVITNPLWEWLRQRLWDLEILLFVVALVCWPLSLYLRRAVLRVTRRAWGFVLGVFFFGPILIVSGFLKAHSGRARPANVDLFGGDHLFTPAGTFAHQCTRNCSFVSGEVASVTVLSLVIWLAADAIRDRLPHWGLIYLRVVAVFLSLFIVVQRIATGRHFLSDTVFAALVSLSVAWLLWGLIFGGWTGRLRAAVANLRQS
ncbi:phosphatase PAP2 family protein [Thioclava sp. BHET1]|nr:phosphatase PAP2 family protein [Thioclava sp. BHET1]